MSVFGRFFMINVNDIDDEITCKPSIFAGDLKIGRKLTATLNRETLQSAIARLISWSMNGK